MSGPLLWALDRASYRTHRSGTLTGSLRSITYAGCISTPCVLLYSCLGPARLLLSWLLSLSHREATTLPREENPQHETSFYRSYAHADDRRPAGSHRNL